MNEPGTFPEGFTVDAVDWLPSGARSGLVRVRGHRPAAVAGPLPELMLEGGGETRRFTSLPDPGADRDATAWRGAYVLDARPAAEADNLWLEWPGGRRLPLPALSVPAHQVSPAEEPASPSGEVVDRAVLAERRARRAESAENAQARIAKEAMRAVEVLELRSAEIEERLIATIAERDVLRDQLELPTGPDPRIAELEEEVQALRAEIERRDAEPPPRPERVIVAAEPPRIDASDAERRAERLRQALSATIVTVGELRLRLHETEVARRTRDVTAAADAVRVAVVESEREGLRAALETARRELEAAQAARDAAVAELAGAQAAQDDLLARLEDTSAQVGDAQVRIAGLEDAVEKAEAAASGVMRSEAETAALQRRAERAEAAVTAAELAREFAEASAIAAVSQRRAAEVAHAAGAAASESRSVPPEFSEPEPEPARRDLAQAAAEQARAAAAREPAPEAGHVVADLSKAAESLRARPTIISATGEPPADLARGRSGRDYPPLRGALVKFAHDDPAAAGRLIAGLLGVHHVAFDSTPDYDLTIAEVGTYAVSGAGATTLVNPISEPRGRPHAAFHLQADALTLAEMLAGVEQRPHRRRGALRAAGSVRQARRLTGSLKPSVSLAEVVRAGAELDPGLVLRGFAYAVRPAWTRGQTWSVELHVGDRPLTIEARHSGGLQAKEGLYDGEPDARVRISEADFRKLVSGGEPDLTTEGDELVVRRLLSLAARARGDGES